MTEKSEALNRKLARKIASQLAIAGWQDAADYVRSDFMATQINLVLREDGPVAALEREIKYLRCYGNKGCTAMADAAMGRGDMES